MTWERRWHPLRREWVTITSHRQARPWSGATEAQASVPSASFDPDCYLCPGNPRVSGARNDDYGSAYVFDNDHPSFGPSAPTDLVAPPGIYRNAPARGVCRVICYSPDHGRSLAALPVAAVAEVVEVWASESASLMTQDDVHHVLVFENKGEVVGVSNPHPHGQIYAPAFVMPAIALELAAMDDHVRETGRQLGADILQTELEDGARIIARNDEAVAFIPWFARFPYEVFIMPRRQVPWLHDLSQESRQGIAQILSEVLVRLDNLWQQSFPYMLIVHQAPCDGTDVANYHCHIQIHPPLRGPGLQKFLAGVETGGGHFLNDTDPNEKAAELRAVSPHHYHAARHPTT